MNLRQLLHTEFFLPAVAFVLHWPHFHVIVQLVLHLVFDLQRFRIVGYENIPPGGRALQSSDVVIDLRERFLVRDTVLFELGFVRLQLGDRLYQSPFAIEHIELELRVAQLDQRLPLRHRIARLNEDAIDAPAFKRIEVDRIHRYHFPPQRDEVMKRTLRNARY